MPRRTFLDANILIAAHRGEAVQKEAALRILTNPDRFFIASPFLALELLPKAIYNRYRRRRNFTAPISTGSSFGSATSGPRFIKENLAIIDTRATSMENLAGAVSFFLTRQKRRCSTAQKSAVLTRAAAGGMVE
jgi:hypothetical protein